MHFFGTNTDEAAEAGNKIRITSEDFSDSLTTKK
jgi:hypothetical protein